MKLDPNFYNYLQGISWFSNCGLQVATEVGCPVIWLSTKEEAQAALESNPWTDARTEAQGDLTGYLAKYQYSSYGGHWNNLAKESRAKLEKELMPSIRERLQILGFGDSVASSVLLDLNRAALEATYRKAFSKVPSFFEKLLKVYENGHLPCGWEGQIINWPVGTVVAY